MLRYWLAVIRWWSLGPYPLDSAIDQESKRLLDERYWNAYPDRASFGYSPPRLWSACENALVLCACFAVSALAMVWLIAVGRLPRNLRHVGRG